MIGGRKPRKRQNNDSVFDRSRVVESNIVDTDFDRLDDAEWEVRETYGDHEGTADYD